MPSAKDFARAPVQAPGRLSAIINGRPVLGAKVGRHLEEGGCELVVGKAPAGSLSPQVMRLGGIGRFRRLAEHIDWGLISRRSLRRCHGEGVVMTLDAEETNATVRAGLNGQAPRCDHVDMLPAVEPGLPECKECLALGQTWARLLVCLTCGWVACSDDSRGGHARAHYRETDHPVAAALDPGSTWRWCYVHRRTV